MDADKNKWNDFKISLEWNVHQIKELIAFRIARANDPSGSSQNFNTAWHQVFSDSKISIGSSGNKTSIFDFITRSTQQRPRDYVRYIRECAAEAIAQKRTLIEPYIVKKVDKAFSNYLRNELVDEIHAILPDIQEILSIISEIRKPVFSISEFRNAYDVRRAANAVKTQDVELVLGVLFHFSVIGNTPRPGTNFFRYENREARFNFKERLIVHRGLFKALQIL